VLFKLNYLIVILTILFTSCESNLDKVKVKELGIDEIVNISEGKSENDKKKHSQSTQFYIKDESQYSANFISEFKEKHKGYKSVSLIEDSIIINNDRTDIILIPTDLPLNKSVTYEKNIDETKYALTVKRISFSTLEYSYFEIVNGERKNEKQGQADLEPVFYLGSEGTFEDENENVFGMNEYIDSSIEGCQSLVYIGVGSIEKTFMKEQCKSIDDQLNTPLLSIKK
jgi:hypothetical protein